MATVSNTPTLRELISVFGGGNSLRDFYRGGPHVPNISQNNSISTNPDNLTLRQFIGATNYTNVSVSANDVASFVFSGTASGTSTANVSGGDGSVSYSWTKVSGTTCLSSGASSQTATFSRSSPGVSNAVYRVTVNDGTSSDYDDITVQLQVES